MIIAIYTPYSVHVLKKIYFIFVPTIGIFQWISDNKRFNWSSKYDINEQAHFVQMQMHNIFQVAFTAIFCSISQLFKLRYDYSDSELIGEYQMSPFIFISNTKTKNWCEVKFYFSTEIYLSSSIISYIRVVFKEIRLKMV